MVKPGNRVGFGRVDLFQTHARLTNGRESVPTTLPMGQISDPCPNPTGHPTRRVTHRVCTQGREDSYLQAVFRDGKICRWHPGLRGAAAVGDEMAASGEQGAATVASGEQGASTVSFGEQGAATASRDELAASGLRGATASRDELVASGEQGAATTSRDELAASGLRGATASRDELAASGEQGADRKSVV